MAFTLVTSNQSRLSNISLSFLSVAEIIAINLRQNDNIEGIAINGITFKVKMLADDTSLMLKDMASVELAIQVFQCFAKYSGLQINLEKNPELIPIVKNAITLHQLPNRYDYNIKTS